MILVTCQLTFCQTAGQKNNIYNHCMYRETCVIELVVFDLYFTHTPQTQYTLLNGGTYDDTDVPEVVHHVDSENPNSGDDDEEEEKVTNLDHARIHTRQIYTHRFSYNTEGKFIADMCLVRHYFCVDHGFC